MGIITVKTFPNIIEPIIKPTLKKANFGPKIFVRLKETRTSKIKIIDRKIPIKQILRDEALEAFEIWDKKTDKIEY